MTVFNNSLMDLKKVDKLTFRKLERYELQKLAQLRWDFKKEEADNEAIKLTISKKNFVEDCLKILQQANNLKQLAHFGAFNEQQQMMAMVSLGIIIKIPEPLMMNQSIAYLTNMYTSPPFRNQGVGKRLLTTVQQWCSQQTIELVVVWPSESSQSFYTRQQFMQVNQPRVWMCKDESKK